MGGPKYHGTFVSLICLLASVVLAARLPEASRLPALPLTPSAGNHSLEISNEGYGFPHQLRKRYCPSGTLLCTCAKLPPNLLQLFC